MISKQTMFTYTNKRGVKYYIHETRPKAGASRYVVKRTGDDALAELPVGMEIVENVNGQVSVRAARPGAILPVEERLVEQALQEHGREKYRVEIKGRHIIVHEPDRDADRIADVFDSTGVMDVLGQTLDRMMRQAVGDAAWEALRQQKREQVRQEIEQTMRYSPVLRFRLDDANRREFSVERMIYHDRGGWLWLKSDLPLAAACDRYVPLLGTEELFEEI